MRVKLEKIESRIILDSRSQPTIELSLSSQGLRTKASVPSGKSKGSFEAVSVPAEQVRKIIVDLSEKITSKEFGGLEEFDKFLLNLDGTDDKRNLGANTTLALSTAFVRLLAKIDNISVYQFLANTTGTKPEKFPCFFVNLINGGLHARQDLNPLPFQEYLIVPQTNSPKEALKITFDFIEKLKAVVLSHQSELVQGDEGGFIISGNDPELGLKILQETLKNAGGDIKFGLDVAATNVKLTSGELMVKYQEFFNKYPLLSIEDPFAEEDWGNWMKLNQAVGQNLWIIGDDLTVTNVVRIQKAQEERAVNAVIIKPNQIGTVTETIEAVKFAKSFGWKVIVSHRSGETDDDFIADLAFGLGADGLKAGSPLQEQRLVKYQRLIDIENSLK